MHDDSRRDHRHHGDHQSADPGFDPLAVNKGGGHNRRQPAQWQTPHKPDESGEEHAAEAAGEPDVDLVEKAFMDAFAKVEDATSFLRLAGIPFTAIAADGSELRLLRVAQDDRVDVGSLTPQFGGEGFRYDPLPAAMVSHRQGLSFVYFDGAATRTLSFEEARTLGAAAGPSR